ncbi:MAG: enoyl-CoA hydratase/isomerase family protein [Candidatus Rokubacteria bacterium]|nr:enoyl-CoA hydratase/isomerase family protein [Candidatus Rokubacteria bacterium]MBI3826316.1 enoyl-CoA hydratase/isomerase family protein [Candidatus Rokubacteria bacterium]
MGYTHLLVEEPAPLVRRLTLNRPEKRNALNNTLRGEIFDALRAADGDEGVRVTILRGAGTCFSAGYDLGANNREGQPYPTAPGDGQWPRHVVEGWFAIWDLAKPVIAQVHGWCLAGGSELATACDLVYVAEDAQIGYPPVRLMSPPDMQFHPWLLGLRHAMELMLTGDAMSGLEAARLGFANRAFPAAELEGGVLAIAERVTKIPTELQQINKRSVHRAMEIMGMRAAIRAGTELQALAFHQRASMEYRQEIREGLTRALTKRDETFGDYRTRSRTEGGQTGADRKDGD